MRCARRSQASRSAGRCSTRASAPGTRCCRRCRRSPTTPPGAGAVRRRAADRAVRRSRSSCRLAGPKQLALLSAKLEDPHGYGRIVRDAAGPCSASSKRRTPRSGELAIHECNTGVLVCPARLLRGWLGRLRTDNAQREYYLTDVIAMAVRDKVPVRAVLAADAGEVQGVNDKAQLAELERLCRARRARELLQGGVTLADPSAHRRARHARPWQRCLHRRQRDFRRTRAARRPRAHRRGTA